ncbi:hypothetical protein KG892_01960 [Vermiphilus pyriformis]|jgi:dihydrofolate synthase/folylpolyglutamate synthase|uniref:Mur ligase central domain-containing protein n=1 Tax=candidate division TM6 bacterium JCVI TM6SC1 TaxID=1306947 RepID=A0A0D2JMK1_9BACT|nr:hypothetical protein J120_01220 [candidate division TM6 bacterium JCVI TM6SC1]UNE35765.1 MAG: hypothetical protein KG892_01960 [Vermiphilus pyriformis]
MKPVVRQQSNKAVVGGKQRSYNEVIEYFDSAWSRKIDTTLQTIKRLDQAFSNVSTKINTILVAGTNGRSLTINFTAQLLRAEGLNVGALYAPHVLTYNERFATNGELISNKVFTDIANEVINAAEQLELQANTHELLTIMALLYFKQENVDVALIEVGKEGSIHPANICHPKVVAITRLSSDDETKVPQIMDDLLNLVKKDTYLVSADQSKLNLQKMQDAASVRGGNWAMPIRKLAQLNYPFEQLHGRCAALAERISHTYINSILNRDSLVISGKFITKQPGQRGRPTRETTRDRERNPKPTIDQYWKETYSTLPGRFEILEKEKPTILLDTASNLDAFENILLGIRLLHYERALKGLTLVIGCNNPSLNMPEFLKLLRYFFKKTSGQVIVCAVDPIPGLDENPAWDVEKVTNDIKSMKIKARSAGSFKEAFEAAQKSVDERHGLVVVTGSSSIVAEYWKEKGIKKL